MKAKLIGLAVAFCLLGACEAENELYIKYNMMSATGLLAVRSGETVLGFCTTTAFERNKDTYRFLTAAHCVAKYNTETLETVPLSGDFNLAIIFAKGGVTQSMYPASVLTVGDMSQPSEGFAILESKIDRYIPIVPLGRAAPVLGEKVSMVTTINELFSNGFVMNEFYTGSVTLDKIEVDYVSNNGENLKDSFKVQLNDLGRAQGASGSAVVSHRQNAIVGVIIASNLSQQGGIGLVAIPISKINKSYKEFKQGKHKLHKEDENTCFEQVLDEGDSSDR